MRPRHLALAVLFGALPLVHGVFGRGPAFTMYASTVDFRLEIVGRRGELTTLIPPPTLAMAVPPSARGFLAGADRFRRIADISVLRHHQDDIARLACSRDASLDAVETILFERTAGRTNESRVVVRCAR